MKKKLLLCTVFFAQILLGDASPDILSMTRDQLMLLPAAQIQSSIFQLQARDQSDANELVDLQTNNANLCQLFTRFKQDCLAAQTVMDISKISDYGCGAVIPQAEFKIEFSGDEGKTFFVIADKYFVSNPVTARSKTLTFTSVASTLIAPPRFMDLKTLAIIPILKGAQISADGIVTGKDTRPQSLSFRIYANAVLMSQNWMSAFPSPDALNISDMSGDLNPIWALKNSARCTVNVQSILQGGAQ